MITHVDQGDHFDVCIKFSTFDASNVADMKTRIQRLLEGNVKPVRLDLSSVDFVDSSAIGALLSLYRATERNLTLVGPNPSVVRALELLRLGNLFSIEAG